MQVVLITARQRSCGKLVFSQVSVILFRGVPYDHYPSCIGPHCTAHSQPRPCPPYHIKQGPLAQSLSPGHHIRQGRPAPTCPWPLTSDIWWPLMETCSDLFTCGPPLILISGDHQSMYSWQIGSMHPTIMLSCYYPTTEL